MTLKKIRAWVKEQDVDELTDAIKGKKNAKAARAAINELFEDDEEEEVEEEPEEKPAPKKEKKKGPSETALRHTATVYDKLVDLGEKGMTSDEVAKLLGGVAKTAARRAARSALAKADDADGLEPRKEREDDRGLVYAIISSKPAPKKKGKKSNRRKK